MRTGVPTQFSDSTFEGFYAVSLEFDSGLVNLWNGKGSITFNSMTFLGAAKALQVSGVGENAEIQSEGIKISLNGADASLLSLALTEFYQYRPAHMYVGSIVNGVVVAYYKVFSGRMDVMNPQDSGDLSQIPLSVENKMIDLERPRVRRWNSEDQKGLYPGDLGLDFLNGIQGVDVLWG